MSYMVLIYKRLKQTSTNSQGFWHLIMSSVEVSGGETDGLGRSQCVGGTQSSICLLW